MFLFHGRLVGLFAEAHVICDILLKAQSFGKKTQTSLEKSEQETQIVCVHMDSLSNS